MKKKLLSFIFAICLIIPAMFCLGGCKEKEETKSSVGLIFELINNNTEYSVAGIGQCRDTDIVIPSTYNGKPVTEISENAFKDCDVIMSVIMPDSIKEIGDFAFEDCDYLERVLLSDNLIEVGWCAFKECISLIEITIPESVENICWQAFTNCSKLTKVIFEKTEYWYHGETNAAITYGELISSVDLANSRTAATYLTTTYCADYWDRADRIH